ncbi:hypothetical protein CBS101457_000676 [Exobasidium rhododendri]|nr:hypothetical protein CBS101457_000676 [Exobasidium rhododendri]
MLATTFLQVALRRASPAAVRNGGLTRCVPFAYQPVKGYATAASTLKSTGAAIKKAPSAAAPKKAATKAAAVKKPVKKAVKEVVKKVKSVFKPKSKPWEARGADGKLLPLPSATKPKRPTPFGLYVRAKTAEARDNPAYLTTNKLGEDKFDAKKLVKAVSTEWTGSDDSFKEPYNAQAREASVKYEAALDTWRKSLTTEDIKRQNAYLLNKKKKTGKAGAAKLRDPDFPRGYSTPFFVFLKDFRTRTGPKSSSIEQAKAAGAEWKSLSKAEKEPFEAESVISRQRYQDELAAYKEAKA